MQHRCRAFDLLILVATPRLHDSRALVVRRQVTRVDERLRYWTLMTWEGPCPPTGLVDQPIRTQTSVSDPQTLSASASRRQRWSISLGSAKAE